MELHPDDLCFQYRWDGTRLDLRKAEPGLPDAVISGTADTFRQLFYRGAAWDRLIAAGALISEGDSDVVKAFFDAFAFRVPAKEKLD